MAMLCGFRNGSRLFHISEVFNIQVYRCTTNSIIVEAREAGKYRKNKKRKEDKKLRAKIMEETFLSPRARKFEAVAQSIADRGFCREQPSYKPPEVVEDQIKVISQNIFGNLDSDWKNSPLDNLYLKYKLLTQCIQHFKHDVPNSILHKMIKIGDVAEFFATPVEGTLPYDVLIRESNKLPSNLHVIAEPIRFHPDTDTLYGGITAFPKSATIVTGLKAKKKYKGYDPNPPMPKII